MDKNTLVGQLVTERPARASVLEQYGIDYCCGGKKTLEEACRSRGVNIEEVLDRLNVADKKQAAAGDGDWTQASLAELIDHIVATYHQPLRGELARVEQLAAKVAKVHGENHPEMVKVLAVFKAFKEDLELHMQKEELILFPGIKNIEAGAHAQTFGCGGGIEHPITVMMQEHEGAGQALATMRSLTNNYSPPIDACNTFKVLLDSLEQIELTMHEHVHKENNILFPGALSVVKLTKA